MTLLKNGQSRDVRAQPGSDKVVQQSYRQLWGKLESALEELQHLLWQLVGLRHHGIAGLLQDLCA